MKKEAEGEFFDELVNSSMSSTSVAMMPPAEEIEEFFPIAKRQEQQRFAEK